MSQERLSENPPIMPVDALAYQTEEQWEKHAMIMQKNFLQHPREELADAII